MKNFKFLNILETQKEKLSVLWNKPIEKIRYYVVADKGEVKIVFHCDGIKENYYI